MATMQGLTGKLSGKMGSAVFRVNHGQQIVSQYNSVVSNPNTVAQQRQRASFKLLSQLAAAMKSGYGTLAVATRPERRTTAQNAFVHLNSEFVNAIADADGNVRASIQMNRVKLTSSSSRLGLLNTEQGAGQVTATVSDLAVGVTSVRFVFVEYGNPSAADNGEAYISEIIDATVQNRQASATHSQLSFNGTVLAYGIIPRDGATKTRLDNMHTSAAEPYISSVVLQALASAGDITMTATEGSNYSIGR